MAPGAGDIRAGRAFVEMFLDKEGLERGLKAAQAKLRAFGKATEQVGRQFVKFGAAVLTPLAASAKVFASYGDDIEKMARRTGLAVEALSELKFVASQTGTDLGAFENVIRRMQRSIYDAGRGLSTAKDALADLDLSFKSLDGLAPDKQFELLADRLASIEDPSRKAAIAMTLFGRSGTAILPMIESGAEGIRRLRAEARALGLTLSSDTAIKAAALTDAFDRLWKSVQIAAVRIGEQLADELIELSGQATQSAVNFAKWAQANGELIISLGKTAAVATALGTAMIGLGIAISTALGPYTLLAAATVALIGIFVDFEAVFDGVVDRLTDAGDASEKFARGTQDEADAMKQKLNQLESLLGKERLTNAERQRSLELIDQLIKRYPKLAEEIRNVGSDTDAAGRVAKDIDSQVLSDDPNTLPRRYEDAQKRVKQLYRELLRAEEAASKLERIDQLGASSAERRAAPIQAVMGTLARNMRFGGKSIADEFREQAANLDGLRANYRDAVAEVNRLHFQLQNQPTAGSRVSGAIGGFVEDSIRRLAEAPARIKRSGKALIDAYNEVNQSIADELRRLQVQSIEDPKQREIAATNAAFDQRRREAQKLGQDIFALERNRQQALQNIRQRYAREERDQRIAAERDIQRQIDRLRVEGITDSAQRRKALLELEKRQLLEDLKGLGVDRSLVDELFQLRAQAGRQVSEATTTSRGIFNPAAIRSLLTGSGSVQQKILTENQNQSTQLRDINRELRKGRNGIRVV